MSFFQPFETCSYSWKSPLSFYLRDNSLNIYEATSYFCKLSSISYGQRKMGQGNKARAG